MENNLSCTLFAKEDLRLVKSSVLNPGPGEVQIAVQKVGICGSDIHMLVDGGIGDYTVQSPTKLGHEACGVVSKLGADVHNLKVGDRVAIECGLPCRLCDYCKSGRYNLCQEVKFVGCPPYHGCLTNYLVHPADFCFKIPDNLSYEDGALIEPLSVAVHACRRAQVSLGDYVCVCGSGPIGLVNVLTARAMGAAKICVTDITASRLEEAMKLGATCSVVAEGKTPKQIAEEVRVALGGQGANVTIECSGAEKAIQAAIYSTRAGGVVVLVGLGPALVTAPLLDAACREVDIRGIWRYVNCYPIAIDMLASGKVDAKPLITHRFPLEKALDAFEVARTGAGGAIKVMIDCSSK